MKLARDLEEPRARGPNRFGIAGIGKPPGIAGSKRHVQGRPLFGGIDDLSAEQSGDGIRQGGEGLRSPIGPPLVQRLGGPADVESPVAALDHHFAHSGRLVA